MVIGDKLNIPVTVNNNLNETSTVEIVFEEYRDGAIYQNRIESNQVLSAMGFKKIMYQVDTANSQDYSNLTLQVTLQHSGKVFDTLQRQTSLIYDGFNDQTSIANVFEVGPPCNHLGCIGNEGRELTESFEFPATMIGKPKFTVKLMSTTFENILDAIKSLI